jgi:predicted enzyme related to lactoylglutathione lyase
MTAGITLVVFPVSDLAQARTLYSTLLGTAPYADQPYYVGFRVGDQEIGLDPNGHKKGQSGPLGYCSVPDVAASLRALLEAGAQVQQPVTDVGGGKLIAVVTDTDGNTIGLIQTP